MVRGLSREADEEIVTEMHVFLFESKKTELNRPLFYRR